MRRGLEPLLVLCLAWTASACAPADSGARPADELETVDVTAAPDAGASLEGDVVARPPVAPAGAIAGALPADFPRDVPLPTPASLVDFASAPGMRSVTLESALAPETARRAYEDRLRGAGFQADPAGGWRGRGRTLSFTVESFHGAARVIVRVAVP